jgi:hypothetical protein
VFVELRLEKVNGVEKKWEMHDAHALGVKWRQRLISASLSTSFQCIPVMKKVVKKVKGKKKTRQIDNILVAFIVEKGYQVRPIPAFAPCPFPPTF